MKKPDFKKGWESFGHWKGWKAAATACKKAWHVTVHWRFWKCLFGLPFSLVLLLSAACASGLVWVFAGGRETQIIAYVLYPLSAYALTALCVKLPSGIRRGRAWLSGHPKLTAVLENQELHFRLGLYAEQFINFAYGCFKIASGVILGSAWVGCDGIYNMAQSLIQLFQILRRRYAKTPELQWKSYRFCGVLILLMHLTLIGIVFQMVNWNRAEEHGQIMVITTALFAFYKIINSFVSIAKDRKHVRPVDSSIRMLGLAQAFFAMFSLQASMFHTFGTGEDWEHGMNILTGCAVCLSVVSIGIYMIRRANREIKKLQESNYGE
ncbi:MAG: hypothetical protein IJB59_09660 [Oscillospiraceae bacterium]|nr:hypothetical protein [Oscillospiraceae bacterium]